MIFLSTYLMIGLIFGSYVGYKAIRKGPERLLQIAQEQGAPAWMVEPAMLVLLTTLIWPAAVAGWILAR